MSRLSITSLNQVEAVLDGIYKYMDRHMTFNPKDTCPIDISAAFLKLYMTQSCGKCTPCRVGLRQLSFLLDRVLNHEATLEDLDAGIYQALENSDCLFVVCSPNLPLSKWCLREIEYFKKLHGGRLSRVYTILADGDPAEAFPQILREEVRELPDGTTETAEVEPLFADVRADTLRGSIRKLKKTEYLRLAAAYYRCSYDGLYKRHRRWLWRVAGCAAALALLVAAGFGVYSWYSRMRYDSAKAATYAAYAEDRTRAGDEPLAIALAAEGWDAAVSSGSPRLMTALRSAAVQYDYRTRALPAAPALSVRYADGKRGILC